MAQGKKITGQIDNLRVVPEEQKKLQDDLKTVDTQKQQAEKVVIVETQQELSAHIADLNNDRFVGTEVKNDNRYNKLRAKQEIADQDQKDLMNAIGRIQDLGTRDKNILLGFLDKGTLQGVNFTRGLAANYAEMMFGQNPTKEEKKQALDWAKQIKGLLQRDNLWDDAKKVNRLEKKQDRLEKRAQNKTEYNEKETIFTEKELLAMFQSTAKMMGQDAFAKALHDKLATLSGSGGLLNWQNMQGLNESLSNP